MDVLGELVVRPRLTDADIDQERTVIVEEIRSYLDDPAEYCQMLIQTRRCSGTGRWVARSAATRRAIRALPAAAIRDFWGALYRPANTVVAVAGDLEHDEAVELVAAAFGSGDGVVPVGTGRAVAPGRARGSLTGKRDTIAGAAVDRRAGPAAATTRTPGTSRSSTPSWATACRAACSSRARGEGAGLRRLVGRGGVRGRRRPRDLGRRGSRRSCRRRSRRSWPSWSGWWTSRFPPRSWRRRRPTSRAASSCAWTTRATSRRGSAGRRRSTTACYRWTRRSRPSRPFAPRTSAARRPAVPRRRAAHGGGGAAGGVWHSIATCRAAR